MHLTRPVKLSHHMYFVSRGTASECHPSVRQHATHATSRGGRMLNPPLADRLLRATRALLKLPETNSSIMRGRISSALMPRPTHPMMRADGALGKVCRTLGESGPLTAVPASQEKARARTLVLVGRMRRFSARTRVGAASLTGQRLAGKSARTSRTQERYSTSEAGC
jgi:hypothetical protein